MAQALIRSRFNQQQASATVVTTIGMRQTQVTLISTNEGMVQFSEIVCLAFLADLTDEGDRIFKKALESVDRLYVPKGSRLVPAYLGSECGGIDLKQRQIRHGSVSAMQSWLKAAGGRISRQTEILLDELSVAKDEFEELILVVDQFRDLGIIRIEKSVLGLLTQVI